MHIINHLYTEQYDFHTAETSTLTYMLATMPRSGSTHFSIELWKTGALGAPMEYLAFASMSEQLMPRLQVDPNQSWFADH